MVAKSLKLDEYVLFLHAVNKYLLLESSVNSVLLSNVFAHVIEHNVRRTKSKQKDENNATLCESFYHLRWGPMCAFLSMLMRVNFINVPKIIFYHISVYIWK